MDNNTGTPSAGQQDDQGQNGEAIRGDSDEDSEWEYEYDENETEEFYVTLDITTYAPLSAPQRQKRQDHEPSKSSAAEGLEANASDEALQTVQDPKSNSVAETPQPSTRRTPADEDETLSQSSPGNPSQSELRAVDLFSKNPIVSYQNNLYSCTWATTLGTDMLLSAKPHPSPSPLDSQTVLDDSAALNPDDINSNAPRVDLAAPRTADAGTANPPHNEPPQPLALHSTPSYTLHTTSRLRLLAKPASIVRPAPAPPDEDSTPAAKRRRLGAAPTDADRRTAQYAAPARHAQTAFLERLAAAKRARGDTGGVPMYMGRPNHQPAGRGGRGRNRARRARRWEDRIAAAQAAVTAEAAAAAVGAVDGDEGTQEGARAAGHNAEAASHGFGSSHGIYHDDDNGNGNDEASEHHETGEAAVTGEGEA